jgi:uracil phosphoribosyltransferase
MQIINFANQNTIINQYMAEIRDKRFQRHRATFRHNIERIGELMAYELSKTLDYQPKTINTPLDTISIPLPQQKDIVVATILRAGIPFHQGFLNIFDQADSAYVSAFRLYLNREHTEVGVHTEYIATPNLRGKTLIIVDPMLATGSSLAAAIEAIKETGKPRMIHLCCVIATTEGIKVVSECLPENASIWCAAIDNGLNAQKYIVPGIGDCGDLCYGKKLQSRRKIAKKEKKHKK